MFTAVGKQPHLPSYTAPASSTPERTYGDWPLALVSVLLMAFGLLMILSASSLMADETYSNALHFMIRQSMGLGGGLVAGLIVYMLPWRWVRGLSWPAYILSIVLLLAVFSPLGHEANGAARWLDLGPIKFQPSELAKLGLILVLGQYLGCNEGRLRDVVGVVFPGVLLLVPFLVLMALQRDFGTTVILLGITALMFFIAGLEWRYGLAGIGVGGILLGVLIAIEPYRIARVTGFLDPFANLSESGYQVIQGWIAMASGGLLGQGLAAGVAQRGFLPEAHTDFISAVVAEELGALGWVVLVTLYALMIWRGSVIAMRAQDLFGTLVAMGITVMLGAQVVINLGVVCGLMPPKGLVLPFMSYGASAVLVHTLCVAILLRISRQVSVSGGSQA